MLHGESRREWRALRGGGGAEALLLLEEVSHPTGGDTGWVVVHVS
jgi:hypothetical protein